MGIDVPILKQGDQLVVSLKSEISDADWLKLLEELSDIAGNRRSRGVILDVSALDVLDSFATRTLRAVAQTLKLRGTETVIVGIQPDMAMAMVQLGLVNRFENIAVGLDLEEGLDILNKRSGMQNRHVD